MGGSTRPICLVVSGGLTLPAGDLADFHDSGLHYDASLMLNIPGFPITLRPEFSLDAVQAQGARHRAPNADDVTSMMAFMGNIEVATGGGLYVIAGGGILSMSVPAAPAPDGEEESSKQVHVRCRGRVPLCVRRHAGIPRGADRRRVLRPGKVGFSKAQFIPITFGLVF